ncbi:MAG: transposase, partial [Rhodospirillaceae bacterium]
MTNSKESTGKDRPWTGPCCKPRFGGEKVAEEALGSNPTDRGRNGTKLHLHGDQHGIPLEIDARGANIHESRLVGSTLDVRIIARPLPTPDQPQNLCLDKGYDYSRVEQEVLERGDHPPIRRIGE